MSAYLHTAIDGNKDFGGYLSVDGEKAIKIGDDMTYELSPGHHSLVIYSTSDAQRAAGKFQATVYNNTSSSGAIMDTLERKSALSNLGDGWEINVIVDNNQMITLNILSKGSKLVAAPLYNVIDLSDEDVAELEKRFEEWKNTPIRSKKMITWGVVLTICGSIGFFSAIQTKPLNMEGFLFTLGFTAVGVLVLVLGSRKKIRRK